MGSALPLQFHHHVPQSMRYSPLQRILPTAANNNPFKFRQSNIFRAVATEIAMADKAEESDKSRSIIGESSGKSEGEKKAVEEAAADPPKDIPPPPEKPLPDDCCGSGCVRCVWDVYYDELEEYNKLYKEN